ncbi:hypothetical protein IW137_000435 [Coemansia sp. RSA 1287]|nr:hypothetical protein IW137_000435 [Coemansia sp. RSA 1287]
MALGNERPRDEPAKSKSKSLISLGQSLRRGLTTRRSNKNAARQAAPETVEPAADRPHAPVTTAPASSSGLAKSSYTPSPLSRSGTAGASGNGPSLGLGGSASLGLGSGNESAAGNSSSIYGNGRAQRIASASGVHSSSAAGASGHSGGSTHFRKTLYGSTALVGLTKSGFNNSSSSLGAPGPGPTAAGAAVGAGGSNHTAKPDAPTLGRKAPPPEVATSGPQGTGNRDYSFAIASNHHASIAAQSARSSAGASITVAKEGYLSKKTDINPSTSLASALSRGWKVYRVVLKGAKIFFYKPPSESELREMFPEEIAAATNETAGGYFRTSMSVSAHDDAGSSAAGFPMAPGEVESGSRGILFEPGVRDGEITVPLCERYTFGECFTEVDLRSLKFKRYVCALIFDDTIVVLKRRWVRQGLASSFFGAVSNKMRFGKSSRVKTHQPTDNSSLVSAELGITGKGYFTKWKFHSQYLLANVEAIEAASSRFSVTHAPGVLGHLGRESQNGSGRISLYSIGNSSVSSVMTRTSTVSKDYSGALSSGLVPGFQIFVGGKERVARMFVATTSDAKNNWLSRFAAAKATYARRLRQRPRENTGNGRRYNGANEPTRPATAVAGKDSGVDGANADERAKQQKDTRTRLFWGTQQHPELVVSAETSSDDAPSKSVVVGGSKSALVHEMIFRTAEHSTASQDDQQLSIGADSFSLRLAGTYPLLMTHSEFLGEFQRYAGLVTPETPDFSYWASSLGEIIKSLATHYAAAYDADQIEVLRAIVETSIASGPEKDGVSVTAAIDRMVPVAITTNSTVAVSSAGDDASRGQNSAAGQSDATVPDSPLVNLDSYEIIGSLPSAAAPKPKPSTDIGPRPLRGRSKTHHGEPDPAVPQIPTVPELIRVEITGLSPSLLLRITPAEFAHQLYLFHKSQLTGFNPKQAQLYMPLPPTAQNQDGSGTRQPTPSLLTVGTSTIAGGDSDGSPRGGGALGVADGGAGGDAATESTDTLVQMQRQLMVFTHSEPHFLTRMIHHQLLVELPLNRPARRSALLQHWVRIGEECRAIGDALSWTAIAMAVTMAPIARLRETWHGVGLFWKDLIVSEWAPLLIKHGICEIDVDISGRTSEARPLVIRPQNKSGASTPSAGLGYSYTPIPYYGPIRLHIGREGQRLRRKYQPTLGAAGSGSTGDHSDRVLFAHYGYMYAAAQEAVCGIPNSVVERARTSIMRSRASSLSLASKFQQGGSGGGNSNRNSAAVTGGGSALRDSVQQQISGPSVSAVAVEPAMQGHPYLQAYLQGLAQNPLKIGDEVVDSDVTEYDVRFLHSISLQCEPAVSDQYHQHIPVESNNADDADHALVLSSLRQAPGSILPLVCPETVPSTNILQWITPTTRTPAPAPPPQPVGRANGPSGRAGTFSHASPASGMLGLADDGDDTRVLRKSLHGNAGSESGDASESTRDGQQSVRHKRSRSFPANGTAGVHAGDSDGDGENTVVADEAAEGFSVASSSEQQINDAARSDALFAGTTVYAANGDLALRVLRVQHIGAAVNARHALRFVVEVQGGTLAILLDLLVNGIEPYSSGLTTEKGAHVTLPSNAAVALVFNRDVFQRTFMASFRHFSSGLDVVDSMRRSLTQFGGQTWAFTAGSLRALLDVSENWLSQHFSDFLDSAALRESMAEFVGALGRAVRTLRPDTDDAQAEWRELLGRADLLSPDFVTQLLTPSGYSDLDKVLDRRLAHAAIRERRTSTTSASVPVDTALQTPLALLSVADPDAMLVALNRLAQTHFARCSFNDWLVAFCLLEVQTHMPLPWYAKKRMAHVPPDDELAVSDIYQVLEQTHRGRGIAQGAAAAAGGVCGVGSGELAASAETALARTMPHSIQTMLELHRTIRGWAIRQIADPTLALAQRIVRIQKFLTLIRLCRKDSHLSTSRVFGTLLNGYMREAGMIPDRQPSYRAGSIKRHAVGDRSNRAADAGRRGRRKGGQTQVKYVPSFVERAVASALVSPESRQFVRAWNEVAAENNTKLDTLEAVLRGARSWAAFGSEPMQGADGSAQSEANADSGSGAKASGDDGPRPVTMQRSQSNPAVDSIDLSDDSMARADCFVPCLGWLLENMVSLCYDSPDTLVSDARLVNVAKRHRVFIMLCVCDQLVSRCQEAFALPTAIRIDITQLNAWVAQTPLRSAELHAASQNELALAGETAAITFTSPAPSHGAGFSRPSESMQPQTLRHGHSGGFAKRSIANLRGAAGAGTGSSTVGPGSEPRGVYARKSGATPDLASGGTGGGQAFGSPPAPVPRSLTYGDAPGGGSAAGTAANAAAAGPNYSRPFTRLVTDEIEKVRQEIRERERLERELRDREQAIERQKNERTKILKRQLKEQQQRRAKNEPLLKMANLMNKVGIGARESSIDGGVGGAGGSSALAVSSSVYGSATVDGENRLSAVGSMRPRGPALPSTKPANVINLINSTITIEQAYTKRDFVFRIVTEEGGQYLLQAPDSDQMEDWIGAMRDAATEAAARRLTLFVEEAKKRNNSDSPHAPPMPVADSESQGGRNLGSETTRSRFTAFLGAGSSAFGAFGMSQTPNRGAMPMPQMPMPSRDLAPTTEPKSFGVDLAELMPDAKAVPPVVEKCLTEIELRGLEEVGIYRVSGAAADVSRLRNMFNADPDAVDLGNGDFHDINVVSGVMKQFLRELPEPLMTFNLYDGFINAASIDDYDERLWAIKDLVHALPTGNYAVLKRLVEHLERVTDYEEVNHMYGTNLALVFGPSLLRPPPGSSSFALAMSNLGHAQSVIKNLILQYHWIFNVEEEAEPIEDADVEAVQEEKLDSANEDSVGKRESVGPLSPGLQDDMDQLALAVNKMSV